MVWCWKDRAPFGEEEQKTTLGRCGLIGTEEELIDYRPKDFSILMPITAGPPLLGEE
jgi:hypothetical protein